MYQPFEIPLPPIPVIASPPNAIPEEEKPFHPKLGSEYMFQYSQCTGTRKVSQHSRFAHLPGSDYRDKLYRPGSALEWMYQ